MPKSTLVKKAQVLCAYTSRSSADAIFKTGNVVGDLACKQFLSGKLVAL
jgi:hypothetical protein